MQTSLLWSGREYYSLENCLVTLGEKGIESNSVIVGFYQDKIYRVEYTIKTDSNGETVFCDVRSQHNSIRQHYIIERRPNEAWTLNGEKQTQFDGCMDVDIPLTPFTNTLPVNRLQLDVKSEQEIKVIYIDLLEQRVSSVRQKYLRLSQTQYHYENVPNDFEADIEVDDYGFVVDYPELFVRKARHSWQHH